MIRRQIAGVVLAGALLTGVILAAGSVANAQPRDTSFASLLVVPANSPIGLRAFDETDLHATFAGRLVLSGTFRYGCADACDRRSGPQDLRLDFAPDEESRARLPHWRAYDVRPVLEIENAAAFAARAISQATLRDLKSGRRKSVTGRATFLIDSFETGLECDAPWYRARFVALAEPASVTRLRLVGDFGCG